MGEKRKIRVDIYNIGAFELEGKLEGLHSVIDQWFDLYGLKYDELALESDYDADTGAYLKITGERLETDREFNRRVKMEEKTRERDKEFAADKEAKELKEFLRLKKKFDKACPGTIA